MYQNTKNVLNNTFNPFLYETFAETSMKHLETCTPFKETGMFHLCFKLKSSNSLKLFTRKWSSNQHETGLFHQMFHKN